MKEQAEYCSCFADIFLFIYSAPSLLLSCCFRLLIISSARSDEHRASHPWDYIYEPDAQTVIDDLLTRYVEALVYQGVTENMASEQSARMVAMRAASDNAKTVISEMQLVYKKSRQASITKELSEIVSGAAAV